MSEAAAAGGWLRTVPLVLVALIVATYAPTWDSEFLVWDDDDHIYENRHIIAEDGYLDAYRDWQDPAFWPATFTTWYVEWRVAGGQPWLFQIDNILLHATNALLLGALLRALGLSYGLAWGIAGVWALHPEQVASVAWLVERKNLLYTLFYLAALLAYARALGHRDAATTRGYFLSLVLFLAALLSKATAVTIPVLLVVTHWVCGGRFDRRAVVRLGSFFAFSIVAGLIAMTREEATPLVPFGTRLLVGARAAWFYVGKFLWPTDLVALYPRWPLENAATWGGLSFAGLAAAAAFGVWQARRIPPIAWWGVVMYAANIALVIGVLWWPFMGYTFVSDHLQYSAAIGLAVVFGLLANAACDLLETPGAARLAMTGALWVVLAALSWEQTGLWENTETLWRRTIAGNPQSRVAHKNLGVYFLEAGRLDEAEREFEATLALYPGDLEATLNMGVLASERGDWETAIEYYRVILEAGAYPSLVLNQLGIASARTGKIEEAVGYYERALEYDPGDARARMNLGAARAALGDRSAAVADYEEAIRLNPGSAEAHYNLAIALNALGRRDEAAEHYQRAHELDPSDVDTLYNLGVVYMDQEKHGLAAEQFRAALGLDPSLSDAAHNLGAVLLATRDLRGAEEAFARANELAPTDPDTARVLAMLRHRRGDVGGAVAVLETALEASPDDEAMTRQLTWIKTTPPPPAE